MNRLLTAEESSHIKGSLLDKLGLRPIGQFGTPLKPKLPRKRR